MHKYFVRFDELGSMARFDGVGFNVVSICCIKNYNITISAVGGDGESACLVAEEFAVDLCDCHVHMVASIVLL